MEKAQLYEELLNLPSMEIVDVSIETKSILVDCQLKLRSQTCPSCGQATSEVNQYYERTIRDLNMGERYVLLRVKMRQYRCRKCRRYFSETLAERTLPSWA